MDADEAGLPSYEEIVGVHDDEDEAYGEQADHFEAAYNFRFEVSNLQTCRLSALNLLCLDNDDLRMLLLQHQRQLATQCIVSLSSFG